jgi:hypothetical protein
MTATTYTHVTGAKPVSGAKPRESFREWLGRIFWRIVDAREKQVRERIARHFRGFDDEYLAKLGYAPADIRRIRQV